MQTYVISLPNARERRAFQTLQLSELHLHFQIIDAVTAQDLGTQDNRISVDQWERPLMPTEIACFFSHYNLWKRIAQDSAPALILEDDAIVSNQLPIFLDHIQYLSNIDHLSLETRSRKKLVGRTVSLDRSLGMAPLYQDRTGAAAYLLWPQGARILVDRCLRHGAAITDALISNEYRLHSWQAVPALAVQSDVAVDYGLSSELLTHSYIQANDCKANYAAHGIESFFYRARRIISQLRLVFRLVSKMTISRRASIPLDPTHFKNAGLFKNN